MDFIRSFFSNGCKPHTARQNFIQKSLQFADQYNFDGIDIDWEYPGFAEHSGRPEDIKNFTLLLKELYTAAKAHNPPLLVTIAAPAGPTHYKAMELNNIYQYLDWINLMGYDFHGPWGGGEDSVTNHHSGLYAGEIGHSDFNVNAAVNYYLSQGFPSEKIILGLAFYGRSYAGVANPQNALYSAYQNTGKGTTEAGLYFFYDIKNNLLPQSTRYWDPIAMVPYLYNPQSKEFVTYEDEESLILKSEYIKKRNLGGAMIWELGQDVIPAWSLLNAVHQTLNQ